MTLSAEELERYARHIVLHEIGGAGQQRLRGARDNARRAVASYLRPALAVAGLGEVRVEAVFADEVRGVGDRWDVSRSLRDVLADPKYR